MSLNHAVPLMNGREGSTAPPPVGEQSHPEPSPQPGITTPLYVSVFRTASFPICWYGKVNVPLTRPVESVKDSFLSVDLMALVFVLALLVAFANVTFTVVTVGALVAASAPAVRLVTTSSVSSSTGMANSQSFVVEKTLLQHVVKFSVLS